MCAVANQWRQCLLCLFSVLFVSAWIILEDTECVPYTHFIDTSKHERMFAFAAVVCVRLSLSLSCSFFFSQRGSLCTRIEEHFVFVEINRSRLCAHKNRCIAWYQMLQLGRIPTDDTCLSSMRNVLLYSLWLFSLSIFISAPLSLLTQYVWQSAAHGRRSKISNNIHHIIWIAASCRWPKGTHITHHSKQWQWSVLL